MPAKRAVSITAKAATSVPLSVTGLHILGIPLSEWAYIAAILSGFVAIIAYGVKMWRDIQIGAAYRSGKVTVEDDE